MTETVVSTFILFLVTVDPVGNAPVFVALTRGMDDAQRRRMAIRGPAIAAAVLVAFALGGEAVMAALGVGIPAFRIAGGVLLFLLAVDMVFARPSGVRTTTAPEEAESTAREDISVFPLAVPLLAGPGAITSVLLALGRTEGDLALQALVVAVMLGVMALSAVSLLFAARVTRLLGVTGTNVVGRVLGIVLAALAAQYVIDGLAGAGLAG